MVVDKMMTMEWTKDFNQVAKWRELAIKAAHAPSDMIVHYFERGQYWQTQKADGSPLTLADQEAEQIIRQVLAESETFDILGEEEGLSGTGSRYRWTIDPIDGTRSFVRGIPLFGTIVGLEDTQTRQGIVGVIHLPVLQKTYTAARGLGSTCNGVPIAVASDTPIREAMVSVGDPLQFTAAQCEAAYHALFQRVPCLRGYTDCFGHALVASGCLHAMLDPSLNPWDIVATQVLVEEAGGTMLLRPSALQGKVDAWFGATRLIHELAPLLGFA
ncbi:MAG: histidinol phosphate phosphatase [Nitrospirae bacterium]|nr:MAG: histidinol phosphate phosphatase [Nitrospirota bacterium]